MTPQTPGDLDRLFIRWQRACNALPEQARPTYEQFAEIPEHYERAASAHLSAWTRISVRVMRGSDPLVFN